MLYINKSINISYNLIILVFVFICYAIFGRVDNYLKVKFKNNTGLSIVTKLLLNDNWVNIFLFIYVKRRIMENI